MEDRNTITGHFNAEDGSNLATTLELGGQERLPAGDYPDWALLLGTVDSNAQIKLCWQTVKNPDEDRFRAAKPNEVPRFARMDHDAAYQRVIQMMRPGDIIRIVDPTPTTRH